MLRALRRAVTEGVPEPADFLPDMGLGMPFVTSRSALPPAGRPPAVGAALDAVPSPDATAFGPPRKEGQAPGALAGANLIGDTLVEAPVFDVGTVVPSPSGFELPLEFEDDGSTRKVDPALVRQILSN